MDTNRGSLANALYKLPCLVVTEESVCHNGFFDYNLIIKSIIIECSQAMMKRYLQLGAEWSNNIIAKRTKYDIKLMLPYRKKM